jgi:hypothetical protein
MQFLHVFENFNPYIKMENKYVKIITYDNIEVEAELEFKSIF